MKSKEKISLKDVSLGFIIMIIALLLLLGLVLYAMVQIALLY